MIYVVYWQPLGKWNWWHTLTTKNLDECRKRVMEYEAGGSNAMIVKGEAGKLPPIISWWNKWRYDVVYDPI